MTESANCTSQAFGYNHQRTYAACKAGHHLACREFKRLLETEIDFLNGYVADPNRLVPTSTAGHTTAETLDELPPGNIATAVSQRRFGPAQLGIQVLMIPPHLIAAAASLSQQTGLLSNDALIVAAMHANGLTRLASNDADFDRVPGLTRYAPA